MNNGNNNNNGDNMSKVIDIDAIEARSNAPLYQTSGDTADFIAYARTDIPALVARVRELETHARMFLGDIREIRITAAEALGVAHDHASALELVDMLVSERDELRETFADALNQIAFSVGCDDFIPSPPDVVVAAVKAQGMRLAQQAEELFSVRKERDELRAELDNERRGIVKFRLVHGPMARRNSREP